MPNAPPPSASKGKLFRREHSGRTVRLESINLLMARALSVARLGGRNGNDDRSYLSREFRSRITSFGTLTAAAAQPATCASPRPQGRLRGAQTGQKRAKTRVKEIDLPKKASASAGAAQRSCLRLTHGGCNEGASRAAPWTGALGHLTCVTISSWHAEWVVRILSRTAQVSKFTSLYFAKVQCCTRPPHTRYAWNQSTC